MFQKWNFVISGQQTIIVLEKVEHVCDPQKAEK